MNNNYYLNYNFEYIIMYNTIMACVNNYYSSTTNLVN